ncbi:MAG: hypothetical protein Q8N44_13060 [Rubrivivax sp.]|nr:hypothetical protein [Rubrivivax sp.]
MSAHPQFAALRRHALLIAAVAAVLALLPDRAGAALFVGLGDPAAGGVGIIDNDANDTNKQAGIIVFNQNLADFTATGTLVRARVGGAGAAVQRLVLTNLTVQAKLGKNPAGATIAFADTFQQIFPNATIVHLSGNYFHGGANIGGADIMLAGFADNLAVGDTALGVVDPLAVANAASPSNFAYGLGKGPNEQVNLGGNKGITGMGGLITFSLMAADGFALPNSAELALSESSFIDGLPPIPEPGTAVLWSLGLLALGGWRWRRRGGN